MNDTLSWRILGEVFDDGSSLADWRKIETSSWHWQYDNHELSFDIYQHDGQYWKLYRARWVPPGGAAYAYGYGGQACRMAKVEYTRRARSTHSGRLMEAGTQEWVRTYEVDETLHHVVKAGMSSPNTRPKSRRHDSQNGEAGVADGPFGPRAVGGVR